MRNLVKTTKQWRTFFIASCFLGLLAPTFFITAFAFLDPSIIIVDVPQLERYNSAVMGWNSMHRREFSRQQYYVNVSLSYKAGSEITNNNEQPQRFNYITSINAEQLPLTTQTNILPYKPLYFICNISSIIPTIIINDSTTMSQLPSLIFTIYSYNSKTLLTQRITSQTVELFREQSATLTALNEQNTNDVIDNDNQLGAALIKKKFGGACFVLKNSGSTLDEDQTCIYGDSQLNYTDTVIVKNTPILFRNTLFKIKANSDPFIVAGDLTDGTFTFGMSRQTQQSLGTIFLILGAALTTLFIVIVLMLLKKKGFMGLYRHNRTDHGLDGSIAMDEMGDVLAPNVNLTTGLGNTVPPNTLIGSGINISNNNNSNLNLSNNISSSVGVGGVGLGMSNSSSLSGSNMSNSMSSSARQSFALDPFTRERSSISSVDRSHSLEIGVIE
ncbi:hypothetical protein SAMD00019534_053560 [Acytostelium subglobosum LB1]|uniref:hypothetical protein n=1 Tax=Acytostelium subglobosum LB1 TaxID=1410327 RepID=UPI000644F36A|nr:hypothetical protein SAMD00019534_053560 [Acytostelium subglobosum LB1]GAM22181.1 hypothetical protein SAMD00019534_053560 [Acytostelium subglobosum LB1]|eukprot:XP_012755281.1 hypothetical protein SAMD00019534_053560 [Acytostelium subglobosum LB1]